MKIADVIRSRGTTDVVTVAPTDSVTHLLAVLAERRIGAVVVSSDGSVVDGIVSERDVVRRIHDRGASVLDAPVSEIMTSEVFTCTPDTQIADIAILMTERRIRHLPVLSGDTLYSIISIGDVVKFRMDQLQAERDQLVEYIQQ